MLFWLEYDASKGKVTETLVEENFQGNLTSIPSFDIQPELLTVIEVLNPFSPNTEKENKKTCYNIWDELQLKQIKRPNNDNIYSIWVGGFV